MKPLRQHLLDRIDRHIRWAIENDIQKITGLHTNPVSVTVIDSETRAASYVAHTTAGDLLVEVRVTVRPDEPGPRLRRVA